MKAWTFTSCKPRQRCFNNNSQKKISEQILLTATPQILLTVALMIGLCLQWTDLNFKLFPSLLAVWEISLPEFLKAVYLSAEAYSGTQSGISNGTFCKNSSSIQMSVAIFFKKIHRRYGLQGLIAPLTCSNSGNQLNAFQWFMILCK